MTNLHQFIERSTGRVRPEMLRADKMIRALYSGAAEKLPFLLRATTSQRTSSLLAYLNYDSLLSSRWTGSTRFLRKSGIDLTECVASPEDLKTPRQVFERQIRYWECRPLAKSAIVSPADSRVAIGSLAEESLLFLKGKFFDLDELLGRKRAWRKQFSGGDFAIFRLTPEKYHYTHVPCAGKVVDFYELDGSLHSCNPAATVRLIAPHSKNRRVVTIIDTNVPNGAQVGTVAMVEVLALMIGQIEQRYSTKHYDDPQEIEPGIFIEKGSPKALFRPGSSTVVLLFEPDKIEFAEDLRENAVRADVHSRFSRRFQKPLVETDLAVRSEIASPKQQSRIASQTRKGAAKK